MNKLILIFFSALIFYSCGSDNELKEEQIVDLPIEIVKGYGPFDANFAKITWKEHQPGNIWYKTLVKVNGIPEKWNDPVVKRILFDAHQFVYQNYKQGNLTDSFYNELKNEWNINKDTKVFTEKPIKCYTHIVLGKDKSGKILYKIDTDNDRDFSDEKAKTPKELIDWTKTDSLSKYAQKVTGEFLIGGKVENIKVPILIVQHKKIGILYNYPQHARTEFMGHKIYIKPRLTTLTYDRKSELFSSRSPHSDSKYLIQKNQFLNLNGSIFKNMGVHYNTQTLILKKIPSDTIVYSNQTGFSAPPFSGKAFLNKDSIHLSDFTGKYLYIEFWGTWCKGCIEDIPYLKKAYDSTERSKIEFLGIANDNSENLKKVLKDREIKWPQIISNEIIKRYDIRSYPTSYLIDKNGIIIAKNLRGENILDTLNHYIN